jgi:glycerophosphoryl diester phosphodiesterase
MNAHDGGSTVTRISTAGLGAMQRRLHAGRAVPPLGGDGRVLVLAHRGSPGPTRPENTVEAVTAALDRGADGVEVDVRLTADGVLVCSHGPAVRTAGGRWVNLAAVASTELRQADTTDGARLATLAEVLLATRRFGRRRVVVEAKPVDDIASAERTADALRAVIGVAGAGVDLTVSSFDASLLALVRRELGGGVVRTALLGETSTPTHALLRRALEEGHDEIHPALPDLRQGPHAVAAARALGVGVTCWTVNSRSDLCCMAELGVEAVVTDAVAVARATLREHASGGAAHGAGCAVS